MGVLRFKMYYMTSEDEDFTRKLIIKPRRVLGIPCEGVIFWPFQKGFRVDSLRL